MPIYEYQCKSCGHEQDILQKMSDEPLTQCPQCNEQSFTKRISATGFRLKGQGWYETDFKSGSKKNLASSESAGSSNAKGATSSSSSSASA